MIRTTSEHTEVVLQRGINDVGEAAKFTAGKALGERSNT